MGFPLVLLHVLPGTPVPATDPRVIYTCDKSPSRELEWPWTGHALHLEMGSSE